MTIYEIIKAVEPKKKVSRNQMLRYIKDCDIKPAGVRQRPQQYPKNSPLVILLHLGLAEAEELIPVASDAGSSAGNGAARRHVARIPSLRELQNSRKKARAGK